MMCADDPIFPYQPIDNGGGSAPSASTEAKPTPPEAPSARLRDRARAELVIRRARLQFDDPSASGPWSRESVAEILEAAAALATFAATVAAEVRAESDTQMASLRSVAETAMSIAGKAVHTILPREPWSRARIAELGAEVAEVRRTFDALPPEDRRGPTPPDGSAPPSDDDEAISFAALQALRAKRPFTPIIPPPSDESAQMAALRAVLAPLQALAVGPDAWALSDALHRALPTLVALASALGDEAGTRGPVVGGGA